MVDKLRGYNLFKENNSVGSSGILKDFPAMTLDRAEMMKRDSYPDYEIGVISGVIYVRDAEGKTYNATTGELLKKN
ncbi:MAG TPA: hypothetical protein VLH19_02960 [Patescibacteria group bacterium]|nr:hypothetical protein [Patescibacteria group bacterium]